MTAPRVQARKAFTVPTAGIRALCWGGVAAAAALQPLSLLLHLLERCRGLLLQQLLPLLQRQPAAATPHGAAALALRVGG